MLLSDVYSDQAKHFHHTRKRPRPEMDYLLPYVADLPEYGNLVDLGCGAGRVYPWLLENNRGDLAYIGVDNAQGFTLLAQDLYPEANFLCQTMNTYVQGLEQQSTNMIMAIASVQHLETREERKALFRNSYRALEYGGILCMTNRAFSDRFLQKYWRQV
jgi:trans-aconitate methyltransferase